MTIHAPHRIENIINFLPHVMWRYDVAMTRIWCDISIMMIWFAIKYLMAQQWPCSKRIQCGLTWILSPFHYQIQPIFNLIIKFSPFNVQFSNGPKSNFQVGLSYLYILAISAHNSRFINIVAHNGRFIIISAHNILQQIHHHFKTTYSFKTAGHLSSHSINSQKQTAKSLDNSMFTKQPR